MRVGNALALDGIDTHGGGVQEHVHHMVVQKIDFVHIEDVAVRVGEDARLEGALAFLDGGLDVQRAHHAVLGGADRKLHHLHRQFLDGRLGVVVFLMALVAPVRFVRRVVVKTASRDASARRQKVGQRAYRRGFRRALLALDQDAAEARIYHVQYQRLFHVLLPDDGRKRKCPLSLHCCSPFRFV